MTDIRILKKGTCPSLSTRSELTYEYGHNEKSKSIVFRIIENTGSGHFCAAWISVDDIFKCLKDAEGRFSLSVFKELYAKQSINNVGFLGAVMLKEGLIEQEKRHYVLKDLEAFTSGINALVTPTTAKKKAKTKKKS